MNSFSRSSIDVVALALPLCSYCVLKLLSIILYLSPLRCVTYDNYTAVNPANDHAHVYDFASAGKMVALCRSLVQAK